MIKIHMLKNSQVEKSLIKVAKNTYVILQPEEF